MPFSCHNPAVLGLAFAGGSTLAWPIHDNASHCSQGALWPAQHEGPARDSSPAILSPAVVRCFLASPSSSAGPQDKLQKWTLHRKAQAGGEEEEGAGPQHFQALDSLLWAWVRAI